VVCSRRRINNVWFSHCDIFGFRGLGFFAHRGYDLLAVCWDELYGPLSERVLWWIDTD